MKVTVTEDCIACELCVELCPRVFQMGEEFARPRGEQVPENHREAVRQAAEECPTAAIVLEQ